MSGGDGANVGTEAGGFATDGGYGAGFGGYGDNGAALDFDAIAAQVGYIAWGGWAVEATRAVIGGIIGGLAYDGVKAGWGALSSGGYDTGLSPGYDAMGNATGYSNIDNSFGWGGE